MSKHANLKNVLQNFYEKNKNLGRKKIRDRFLKLGAPERSLNNWLSLLEQGKTLQRKVGIGRPTIIASKTSIRRIKKAFDHRHDMSQRKMASKLNCSHWYVGRILKKYTNIKCLKKYKKPQMTDLQKKLARPKCRRLLKKFAGHDFIIDDESYFTLSHTTLSGNNRFYSSNLRKTPDSIKNRYVTKFEPKILVYLAISPRGMSRPIFFRTGLAVNQNVYKEKCLKLSLIPFIRDKYRHRPYVFWPDLASSHYANSVQNYLLSEKVKIVPKMVNLANVSKARPIEDFWGCLKQKVYN